MPVSASAHYVFAQRAAGIRAACPFGLRAQEIPEGRHRDTVRQPDEIAKAVVFLACDDNSFVNGIELFVDGGMAQI